MSLAPVAGSTPAVAGSTPAAVNPPVLNPDTAPAAPVVPGQATGSTLAPAAGAQTAEQPNFIMSWVKYFYDKACNLPTYIMGKLSDACAWVRGLFFAAT